MENTEENRFSISNFGLAFGRVMQIKLSTLAMVMGLGMGLPQIYGLAKPAEFAAKVRKFPRSVPIGVFLMLLGTAWFVYYLSLESISDFANYKNVMLGGFAAIGIASCLFVQDFLAVRGLAIVFLVLAKLMVDTARWNPSDWRLVVVTWAYLLVIAGIWFTIWPWHMRDVLTWATANEKRVRVGSALRLAFGLFVAALGMTVL
jgi:hypothetical protein